MTAPTAVNDRNAEWPAPGLVRSTALRRGTSSFEPVSFALMAVGLLLMRAAMLALSTLPDLKRLEMARRIAAGDRTGDLRSVKEFRTAAGAVWFATLAGECSPDVVSAFGPEAWL